MKSNGMERWNRIDRWLRSWLVTVVLQMGALCKLCYALRSSPLLLTVAVVQCGMLGSQLDAVLC